MIPTSYLFKDLYRDNWGDPCNPHAVKVQGQPTLFPPHDYIGASHIWEAFVATFRRPVTYRKGHHGSSDL